MSKHDIFNQARYGTLPDDFDNWSPLDNLGRSVAHVAAIYGHLPADFDQWDITASSGHTVAHIAAMNGHLPADFDRWEMTDSEGLTVREAYEYHRHDTPKRGNEK